MPTDSPIATAKVADRRVLNFTSIDEVLVDAAQLADAQRQASLHQLGNWTLGQSLGHLAAWVNYSFDGVPLKIPFFVRWITRFMKNRTLYKPMSPGSNIPGVPGGTLATKPLSTDEGVARITEAFGRLKASSPALPHVLFGPLTHDEWINQHLRHAELHLSFFKAK